jgi:ABC-type branched-subunit amino acid transport system ATPase component
MMLEVNGIKKRFNGVCALDGVSFTFVGKGILGIAGPNGSGKTTLLNVLSGNYTSDAGTILFQEQRIERQPLARRSHTLLSRTYQDARLWPNHTVAEQMRLVQQWGNGHCNSYGDVDTVLKTVGLDGQRDVPAWSLSFGQRRRLELARTLLRSDLPLLLMDEPTSGGDPCFLSLLAELLSDLKVRGKCIVLVEHNLEFLARSADELLILESGRVLATGTPEEVLKNPDVERAYLGVKAAT